MSRPALDATDPPSDTQLVDRTRDGDGRAYAELWHRHYRAGVTVARSYTASFDPDDLVSEAFTRTFAAIADGGGPTAGFRPYLFAVIRNTAASWGRRASREIAVEHAEEIEDPRFAEATLLAELDRSLAARAFRALPPRWQEVLWYTEVEALPPREVAPLLGMSPNAVAALAARAREGLRASWIRTHLPTLPEDSECHWAIEHLGVALRKRLATSARRRVDAHLAECDGCLLVAGEAAKANTHIGLVLLPLAAGIAGAAAYAGGVRSGEATAEASAAGARDAGRGSAAGAPSGARTWAASAVVAGAAAVAATSIVAVALTVTPHEPVTPPVTGGVGAAPRETVPLPAPAQTAPPASLAPDLPDASGSSASPEEPEPAADPVPPPEPDPGPPPAREDPATVVPAQPPVSALPPPVILDPAVRIGSDLPVVSGTARAGNVIAVALVDATGAVLAEATAIATPAGTWSVVLDLSGAEDAVYTLTATATDGTRTSAPASSRVTLDRAPTAQTDPGGHPGCVRRDRGSGDGGAALSELTARNPAPRVTAPGETAP
jgi:RNA polymerase sigma factor (sigma-70 family)